MSFNTSWNVDKYRNEHENEEHWQLRRCFMVAHQGKIPEDRLVCLAQVFSNIEFLGCRYPLETMQLVEELSKGIADDYRERNKSKLQRTFINASDAVCSKYGDLKRLAEEDSSPVNSPTKIPKNEEKQETSEGRTGRLMVTSRPDSSGSMKQFSPSFSVSQNHNALISGTIKFVRSEKTPDILEKDVEDKNNSENNINGCELESSGKRVLNSDTSTTKKEVKKFPCGQEDNAATIETYVEHIKKIDTKKFGKFILVDVVDHMDPSTILERSSILCNIPFRIQYDNENGSVFCRIYINEQLVVSVFDAVRETAREVAIHCALEKLRDVCYFLTVKKFRVFDDHVVDMVMIDSITCQEEMSAPVPKVTCSATPLPEDNVGSKLMRSMGWEGGGLGKTEQGIQEPVSVSFNLNRAGLGNKQGSQVSKKAKFIPSEKAFRLKAKTYLNEYITKDLHINLNFQRTEFSKFQLKTVRQLANSMGLQCFTNDCRLIVSKREPIELIVARMLHLGIYCDEYSELQEPRNRKLLDNFEPETLIASDFPELCQKRNDSQSTLNSDNVSEITGELMKISCRMKKPVLKKSTINYYQKHNKKESPKVYCLEAITAEPYGHFFLIEHVNSQYSPWSIMRFSALQNGVRFKIDTFPEEKSEVQSWSSKILVNGHLLTLCCGKTSEDAQEKCINEAYEKLKQICYVLKIKSSSMPEDPVMGKPDNIEKKITLESNSNNSLDKLLREKFGSKLIQAKKCPGEEKQGMEEPVSGDQRVYRSSIVMDSNFKNAKKKGGHKGLANFRKSMLPMLEKYVKDGSAHGLIFSSDFAKGERTALLRMARKLGLNAKSCGFGHDKYLVLSNIINYCQVVEEMLRTGEYSSPLYELIKPPISLDPSFHSLPDHECDVHCDKSNRFNANSSSKPSAAVSMTLHKEVNVSNVCQTAKEESLKVGEVSFKNEESSVGENSDFKVLKCHEEDFKNLLCDSTQQQIDNDKKEEPYGPLILLENEQNEKPLQIIVKSANACHVPFTLEYCKMGNGKVCRLFVNKILVTTNFGKTKKKARNLCANDGLEKLREVCYTLRSKMTKCENFLKTIKFLKKPNGLMSYVSSHDSEIVCHSKQLDWLSLGLKNRDVSEEEFISKIHEFLRKYRSEIYPYDVIVSPDFTANQLARIQQIASKLGLKVAKQKFAQNFFLIINKKLTILEITKLFLSNEENVSSNSIDKANAAVI